MVIETKLRKIGNSVGIVLPKEALAHLKAEEGDTIVLTETAQDGLQLRADHGEFTKKMEVVDDLCRRYRNALRELSK
jgi:putative addiction module antidote